MRVTWAWVTLGALFPGRNKQRTTMYAWNAEFTRYYNERFGVTLDARGNNGTAYVGLNPKYADPSRHRHLFRHARLHLPLSHRAQILHLRPRHGRLHP